MDSKLNINQQFSFAANAANKFLVCIRKNIARRLQKVTLPLCGNATSAVLCPSLVSLVQKRHRHTGISLTNGHENDEGLGAFDL